MIKMLRSDKIVEYLLKTFPEFEEYDKENIDIPHVIVGNFAAFLIKKIEGQEIDDVVKRSYQMINDLFSENNDRDLLDLIQIELFENLAQSKPAINFSRTHLNEDARKSFEKAMKDFGPKI